MPISNLSNGLRTGVCTSTNRPTTPYEGQVIYETDTDLSYVWGGTAWQQIAGGTAVGNSGLVYVTSATLTGSSTVVSNCFSATYDSYRCVLSNFQSNANWLGVQLGSTVTGYYFAGNSANYANGNFTGGFFGSNSSSFGAAVAQGSSTNITGGGYFELYNPFLTTETTFHSNVNYLTTTGYGGTVNGFQNSDTSFTSMTITSTSMSGTLRIYGYRQ
jgi:hypothetical protein